VYDGLDREQGGSMAKDYRNFDIHLFGYQNGGEAERCQVLVSESIAGADRIRNAELVLFPQNLRLRLGKLEGRQLSYNEIVGLGTDIANILLPQSARSKLLRSLPRNEKDPPLRIRIKCDDIPLEAIPWEYVYLNPFDADSKDRTGFVVLNSNTSVVRYQLMDGPTRPLQPLEGHGLSVMAGFSSPRDQELPGLAQEKKNLVRALRKIKPITHRTKFVNRLTVKAFSNALISMQPDILHYAGHGEFCAPPDAPNEAPRGYLIFENDDGSAYYYPSDLLAVDLRDKNVRLVVLSACKSAKGTGENVWVGVAPALVHAGIPAVVGMQFSVFDDSVVEFAEQFYSCLASGNSIDEAITEGRKAIIRSSPKDRDFGVPVLYLRCNEGSSTVLFPKAVPAATSPGTAPAGTSDPAPDLEPVLKQIGQLEDYKSLHDAMQNAREGGLTLMLLQIDSFPAKPRTVADFNAYVSKFKVHLGKINEIVDRDQCERNFVTELRDDFGAAVGALDSAVAKRDNAAVRDSIMDLESHITQYSSNVNVRLVSTAERLELDGLLRALKDTVARLPAATGMPLALDELAKLSTSLKEKVDLHNACQIIDSKLSLIKRKEPDEYVELIKHWNRLSTRVIAVHPRWLSASAADLLGVTQRISDAVAKNDVNCVVQEFVTLCSIVQTGFSIIDTDLLHLCTAVQNKAQSILRIRQATVTVH
jgi:hypothetical protein